MIAAVMKIVYPLLALVLAAWLGSMAYGESEALRTFLHMRLADATVGDILIVAAVAAILAK